MNCAKEGFKDCKGEFIRSTSLMGDDYALTIPFPGSAQAIVRYWERSENAYIEFRGFENKKARLAEEIALLSKIRTALGDQLYDPYETMPDSGIHFYGLSVKDRNGFFAMNLEIFSGSSSADIYLLGPEKEDDSQPKKDFVLLKVYGGIPGYRYYIPDIIPPVKNLHKTLRYLVHAAGSDFDTLQMKLPDVMKRKSRDTISLNGMEVLMNYYGSHFSAKLKLSKVKDSVEFNKHWHYYEQVLQAALGREYVYQYFETSNKPLVVYFRKEFHETMPRIYLESAHENGEWSICVRIESSFSHPTKRGLSRDD